VMWGTAGGMVVSAGVTTVALKALPVLFEDRNIVYTVVAAAVGVIGSTIGVAVKRPKYKKVFPAGGIINRDGGAYNSNDPHIEVEYSVADKLLFSTFFVSQGMLVAPLLLVYHSINPAAFPIALAVSASTFAGMVTYALNQPRGALIKWGASIDVLLWGVLATGLVATFTKSSAVQIGGCLLGIGTFAACTAYDVHSAVESFRRGQPNYMFHACSFYTDFINLLLKVMNLFIKYDEYRNKRRPNTY